ncbi:MAG: hypothetical protein EU533_04430 [Promethearchaeota archaeon]|nr:MAG: hypothetical protein EU533_04430 [Candidatus Lokiarchaeota archaeon]
MTTTIQIDDDTKKKLFTIKLRLEEQKGTAVTYNELIKYLIESQPLNLIRNTNLKEFKSLRGFLPQSARTVYRAEKKKELEQEESVTPLNNGEK